MMLRRRQLGQQGRRSRIFGVYFGVRKPPELIVLLAPAMLITAVVVALLVMVGQDPQRVRTPGEATPAANPDVAAGRVVEGTPPGSAPFLVAPSDVLEPAPPKKFRVLKAYSFTLATFNMLGASHTSARGNKPRYADSSRRTGWAVGLLNNASADVVGLQEFEVPQYQELNARAGGTWDLWPGLAAGRAGVANSIAWRQDVFTPVETHTISIPYFHGRQRPMPYLLLEHKATGQRFWVANFHNPADTRGPASGFRAEATRRQIALVNQLAETDYPVFLTGDFNEKAEYFCRITMATELKAANGGSQGVPCRPPAKMGIDWIFGSEFVTFASYTRLDGGLVNQTSDHPLVFSSVSVPETRERIIRHRRG